MTHFRKSQQIDNYIFPSITINKMKNSIRKTQKTDKEHGFTLCIDENTNKIYGGPEHAEKGNSGRITFISDCERKNQKHAGTFHSHINTDSDEPSALDTYNNCQEINKIDCIGSAKDGKITCITKLKPFSNCQSDVKPLVDKEDMLIEENQGDEDELYSRLDKIINENFRITELK